MEPHSDDRDLPVVILCGGRGTRLREHTESIPKPLVEVGGMPILWHIMKIYSHHGFRNFVLCLGYKGEKIREYFMNLTEWRNRDVTLRLGDADRRLEYHEHGIEDWNITFVDTGLDTETGGRIKRVEKYVKTSTFFVTYGDGVSDIDIKAVLAHHRAQKRLATMTCVRPRTHFGLVDVGPDGAVAGYNEKPLLATRVNGGFFAFDRHFFEYLGDNDTLERKPLDKLIQDKQLTAHVYDGFWACMDTFKDNQMLNELWTTGKAPWKVW